MDVHLEQGTASQHGPLAPLVLSLSLSLSHTHTRSHILLHPFYYAISSIINLQRLSITTEHVRLTITMQAAHQALSPNIIPSTLLPAVTVGQ
jgi:hypothetical protein